MSLNWRKIKLSPWREGMKGSCPCLDGCWLCRNPKGRYSQCLRTACSISHMHFLGSALVSAFIRCRQWFSFGVNHLQACQTPVCNGTSLSIRKSCQHSSVTVAVATTTMLSRGHFQRTFLTRCTIHRALLNESNDMEAKHNLKVHSQYA